MPVSEKPVLSEAGRKELERYGSYLREEQDLSTATVRNYLRPERVRCFLRIFVV